MVPKAERIHVRGTDFIGLHYQTISSSLYGIIPVELGAEFSRVIVLSTEDDELQVGYTVTRPLHNEKKKPSLKAYTTTSVLPRGRSRGWGQHTFLPKMHEIKNIGL